MQKMSSVQAIKGFFERDDKHSPGGGKKIDMTDLKTLSPEARKELGELCAKEIGVEIQA